MHEKRVLVLDADYQRGGISGRFFPDLIEEFAEGAAPGTTLYHKYQQLYSASDRTPNVDIRSWDGWGAKIDVIPADPRLSTVSSDKLPSANNIRSKERRVGKECVSTCRSLWPRYPKKKKKKKKKK